MTDEMFLKAVSAVLMVLVTLSYSYYLFYLILPVFHRGKKLADVRPNRYAILIAARNEEAVLPHLLDSIAAQDYPRALVTTFVVADNCTDRTAEAARAHGAQVYSRFDRSRVGKGYALNYLLKQIQNAGKLQDYDAFLIFDADNLLRSDYISQINAVCSAGYPVFCGYRNSKNFGDNWLSAGYSLWYLHDCTHANRARMALGICCQPTGTGFGFTRQLLEEMGGWNFFTLTEDIEFRTWCATHGVPIGYCHDAVLYDEQPTSMAVSVRQRTRWTQGGIQVSARYATDYFRGICRGGRTGWSSFEALTQSLWGFGLSALSFGLNTLTVFLERGWLGAMESLLLGLLGAYLSLFAVGMLTMAMEHRRILAGRNGKLMALFAFPVFMMSFIPIAVMAVFRKFQWQPVVHTCAISAVELQRK